MSIRKHLSREIYFTDIYNVALKILSDSYLFNIELKNVTFFCFFSLHADIYFKKSLL